MIEESFIQKDHNDMKNWILLDTGSSTDIFCNQSILTNVTKQKKTLNLHTNGGVLVTNEMGKLPKYGKVWYSKDAITNILSLHNAGKKFRITYDSWKGDTFKLHLDEDRVINFDASENGIYQYDNTNDDFCFVETVAENETFYTN